VSWFREALAVTATTGWLGPRMMALSGLAAMSAALGDLTTAEQSVAAVESFPGQFGFLLPEQCAGPVWTAVAQGRTADARAILVENAELAARTGHLTVEAWLRHDAARLGRPADELARLQELAAASQSPLVAARATHVAAEVQGDAAALEAAGDGLAAFGVDLAAAEAVASAADAARAAGDQRLANRLAGRAHDLLARCEGARSTRVVPAETVVPLTAREREIATLAAAGAQSKDIADRLYLSVRTVNNHLQNAYTKLGVSSRAELAKVLGREGGPKVG
jgi:DNA-binding NarL/FixJ family response regulator